MRKDIVQYDTETNGLRAYRPDTEMFSFGVGHWDGRVDVHRLDGSSLRQGRSQRVLDKLWSDLAIAKTMHNAKFDLAFTEKLLKRKLDNHVIHDTLIMSRLLQSSHPSHRLNDLAWELAGVPVDDESELKPWKKEYQNAPEHLMDRYQKRDGERGMLLHRFFLPKILASSKLREIYGMEMDLIKNTLRMEQRGIMLNRDRCGKLVKELSANANESARIFSRIAKEVCGYSISPSQTEKVSLLLFEKMGFPVLVRTKKTRIPSTDKGAVLLPLREICPHPILEALLQYRSWSHGAKVLSSYIKFAGEDDIIHPKINTCGASTGRESCSEPNLQNVEKLGVLKNPYPTPARKAFRPRPGYVNFHIDYSGIEMRLLVHYSKDERMIREFNREGGDPHGLASEIFYPEFTKSERKDFPEVDVLIQTGFRAAVGKDRETLRGAGKNTNFAIPFGANWIQASKTLNIPKELGRKRIQVYRDIFKKLVALGPELTRRGKEDGMVETDFGRPLQVPRQKAYIATNYVIQGTAAGILKRAQNRVARYLREATGGEVQILLPIHDELIIECPRKRLRDAREVFGRVAELMTDFPQFSVPLEIKMEVATYDWSRKKEFEL